ncbi:hypothetical protein ACVRY7_05600 [Streptococcus ictaluri]|uniref:Uncharacterized protein n=1 Tax=Streptococcus ictaluri 707-05 TaxID=764299 RepID=G5K223_9STRE|nr:hypothetical protein [Streptococcus ictaluri]EHI70010.1 hypothetical protein STRIC_2431 [Streptococcus ictaluri 707-05]QBX16580.1 hypothetical protein Javan261_0020 [Streptococcus phage Javan261]
MSDKKPEDYLVDSIFAAREIPNELDKRGYMNYQYIEQEGIYKISCDFEQDYQSMKEIDYIFDPTKTLRQVRLSKSPTNRFYNDIILNRNWNTQYPYGHNNAVHRGHYIANKFKEYLVQSKHLDEQKVINFFGRGNVINVYPQSANSNCNSEMTGQLVFEQKVWEFLDKSELHEVFYEIENFIVEDKKSLGRRIKGLFIKNGKLDGDMEHFHVFIPNIYDETSNIPEPEVEDETMKS